VLDLAAEQRGQQREVELAWLRPLPEAAASGAVTWLEIAGLAALTIGGRLAAAVVFKDWPGRAERA
jgi:hypothetical protein